MLKSNDAVVRAANTLNANSANKLLHQGRISPATIAAGYRQQIDKVYGGTQGALLAVASALSGNSGAAERILRDRHFDLRGLQTLLDVGSGAGQLAAPIMRYADRSTNITCADISTAMLQRTRARLASDRPRFVVADVANLPFARGSFDGITCGYVLEHLRDPTPGLAELARVLMPGGRLLLLTTEDNLFGMLTSQTWRCRTHNRDELRQVCRAVGLQWNREIQTSRWHQMPWISGICVELIRPIVTKPRRSSALSKDCLQL